MAQRSDQFQDKDILVFAEINGMNTQADRHDLPEDKAAWMENLQPISKNNILTCPAPAAAIATLTGEVITKQFYFQFGQSTDYVINFCASGAAYAVTNPGGAITKFANAGTFSSSPDATQLGTSRLLIADSIAGYSTWTPTNGFVQYGGVSPNILITAGGSGYTTGATVAITTSGAGTGATGTVQTTAGVVTGITLTAAGTGYAVGDTVTFAISPVSGGSGATATGHIWPNISPNPTTIAVFQGRVWLAQTNVITYTGTGASYGGVGYDDFISGDASGDLIINDPDLVHTVTALRSLNNYLFIIGDNSVKQIGNISVSSSVTNFTLVTLSSDQGTTFRDSVVSYNRLMLFANTVGVYAVFGTSVEKISDEMDGIFRLIDFSQTLSAAVNDINNIHCFLLLVKYNDPVAGARGLILAFMSKKWFVISQGNGLKFIVTGIVNGTTETFSTSGADVTEILANYTGSIGIKLQTSLTSHGAPFIAKRIVRYAVTQNCTANNSLNLLIESERDSQAIGYTVASGIQFVNNAGSNINFLGAGSVPINFVNQGIVFQYQTGNTGGISGIYLGATLTGDVIGLSINSIMLEFGLGAAFGSTAVQIGNP